MRQVDGTEYLFTFVRRFGLTCVMLFGANLFLPTVMALALVLVLREILETMADLIVYQRRYQLWRAAMCALMRAEEQLDRLRAPALLDDELVAWHIQQLQERYPLD